SGAEFGVSGHQVLVETLVDPYSLTECMGLTPQARNGTELGGPGQTRLEFLRFAGKPFRRANDEDRAVRDGKDVVLALEQHDPVSRRRPHRVRAGLAHEPVPNGLPGFEIRVRSPGQLVAQGPTGSLLGIRGGGEEEA